MRLARTYLWLLISLSVFITTGFLGYQHQDTLVTHINTLRKAAWSKIQRPTEVPFRDLTKGLWVPSEARRADAALWNTKDCQVDTSDGAENHPDLAQEKLNRLSNISAWEWIADDSLPLVEWDARAFVERAIQSRVGVMIIGDSLSENTWDALARLISPQLAKGPGMLELDRVHDVYHDKGYANETNFYLSPAHPLFYELKKKYPNIPDHRFHDPLINGIRTDIGTTETEMEEIMLGTGYNKTIRPMFRSRGDWRGLLQGYADAGGWEGELPAIVIVNTGVHWNREYMYIADEDYLLKAYHRVVELIRDSINDFSQRLPMRAFWRSVSPGHFGCKDYHQPVQPGDPITLPKKHHQSWHIFGPYNDIAKSIIPPLKNSTLNQITFFDIWDMSVLRPDAHIGYLGWGFDCIHWCSPSTAEWWIRTLWHHIVEHSW
ncbi:hypothetical protein FRB99_008111 [Tulasnella sp. 403]|nr:hypothetical protein FRB99_008111 [Tulasnella sp. 403]